jgi:hypothetical protein
VFSDVEQYLMIFDHLNHPYIFISIFLLTITLFFLLRDRSKHSIFSSKKKYKKRGPLLTPAEQHFYKALLKALHEDYGLGCKVRIGDVIEPDVEFTTKKNEFEARAKINQKHFDFVIFEKKRFDVLLCIELQDSSHDLTERINRDKFVRDACQSAKVPLLEIKNRAEYDIEELRDLIEKNINDKNQPLRFF